MHPKLPLPRGWKRRVWPSDLHILALNQSAGTTDLCTAHVNQYTARRNLEALRGGSE